MARYLTRRGVLVQLAATGFLAACAGGDKGEGGVGGTGGSGDSGSGDSGSGTGGGGDDTGLTGGDTGSTGSDDTGAGGDDTGSSGGDDTGEPVEDHCDVEPADMSDVKGVTSQSGEGPNWRDGAPERSNINPREVEGYKLWVVGQIFDRTGLPIEGAKVDCWQCDDAADYNLESEDYQGHGYQITDANGAFCFETFRPPAIYNEDGSLQTVQHIHIKVWVEGEAVETYQIYFADDPTLPDSDRPLPPDTTAEIEELADGEGRVRQDFVLPWPVEEGEEEETGGS